MREILLGLAVVAGLQAQPQSLNFSVAETGGIRRTAYPVNAHVPFLQGALAEAGNARLTLSDKEVPAQYGVESKWADGSIQSLAVDFNASIGPGESQTYRLEYGAGVRPDAKPRGLTVTEEPDAIQVGNMRFSKSGAPLLQSVKYRGEEISSGANGIAVTDAAGKSHDLTNVESLKVEIVQRGPLYVVLRYSGRMVIDPNYSAPFAILAEMPNSKSWVKISAVVEDPAKRLREISLQTPLAFGPLPWVWDFGTDRWTYGSLPNAAASVILNEVVKAPDSVEWQVSTGPKGQERLYETSLAAERPRLARWGHFQDGKEAVAFAIESPGNEPGTYRVSLNGAGEASYGFAPASPGTQQHLTVYQHFVTTPVHVGAATSPSSALSPLVVTVHKE